MTIKKTLTGIILCALAFSGADCNSKSTINRTTNKKGYMQQQLTKRITGKIIDIDEDYFVAETYGGLHAGSYETFPIPYEVLRIKDREKVIKVLIPRSSSYSVGDTIDVECLVLERGYIDFNEIAEKYTTEIGIYSLQKGGIKVDYVVKE